VSPASLFQEIHSYIKGSSNALRSVDGRLTRQEYNDLGAKMAPNFKKTLAEDLPGDRSASRDFVFDLFLKYEEEKKMLGGYDISDVVFHIWSQLAQQPAEERTLIHSIFVDETQDFTQAELALFVRIAKEKNDLFFSGDTCQTIASGVGFRFDDLKSIFKYEADRQLDELSAKAQSLPAGLKVKIPEVNALTVNYRTHNGILAAAAGIVDLLEFFFPQAEILKRQFPSLISI
jgi:superfamily I DNA/RNA helicase